MRDALRDFLRSGQAISEDAIRNVNDVQGVLGLVRASKLKADDPRVPASVRKIIEDMKADGLDPATARPGEIKDWFKHSPDALAEAKKANEKDIAKQADVTNEQIAAKTARLAQAAARRDVKSKTPATSGWTVKLDP